jgi:L-fucose isomerase-like protein
MTQIDLVRFAAIRHDSAEFARDRDRFLEPLRSAFDLREADAGAAPAAALQVSFIASGGSEQEFRRRFPGLEKPVVLLADGRHNSLPAALEIAAWVRSQGQGAEIVHGSPDLVIARLAELARFHNVRRDLRGPIAVIGGPSDWLIASDIDRAAAAARWGTRFLDVDLGEVNGSFAPGEEADALGRECLARAAGLDGIDEEALRRAAALVPALAALFARHGLKAATLRCFDLIGPLATTGCLALALLNDSGRVCGCEGDVPAVFTMLLARSLTGALPFMANPAVVDPEGNEIVLAHCTVPSRAVKTFRLQTHFETGRGVALCGAFPAGAATLLKVGGPDLGRYFVSAAEALPAAPVAGLCRTQVRLRLQEPASYFLRSALANHHVLVQGDHAREIDDFLSFHGAKRVDIRNS